MFGESGGTEDDSPESPPPFEQNATFSQTKIRVETGDGQTGLRYSLDRMGQQSSEQYGDFRNIEGMVGFGQRPSSSSNVPRTSGLFESASGGSGYWSNDDRGRSRPATATATSSDRGYNSREHSYPPNFREERHHVDYIRPARLGPLYDVESEIMLPGISARVQSNTDGDRNSRLTPPAPRPKNCCWNCKGDHMITECPEPRDGRRIAMNRKTFMAAKALRNDGGGGGYSGGGRAKRYHEEQSGRLGSAKPGILSDELRFAMELGPDEVPQHVYRMRLFGYPPGWLDYAMEESSSGLKLYGDTITMPAGSLKKDPKINPDSIIAYPGFNAPMPYGQPDRGREYGCPRYRTEDSIENMLRKLNARNLVSEGDGIVSQSIPSSQPPQWDSLAGLDRPVLNDGASHGIGRGRYIEVDTLPRHLQPGRGILGSPPRARSPVYRERIDREPRRRPRQRAVVVEDVDERYLPQQPKTVAHKRSRRNSRTPSPSLLQQDGMDFDSSVIPRPATTGRISPVIVNLPPVPGSGNQKSTCDSDASTGSSNDFNTGPAPKRRKKAAASETDDEVTIIPPDKDDDYDSDCLVIDDTQDNASPVKSVCSNKSPVKKFSHHAPRQEMVQVDSRDSEDWENDAPRVTRPKPLPSPGSSTGDEASFMSAADEGQGRKVPAKPTKPSVLDTFDEDWEERSNGSDNLVIVEDPIEPEDENSSIATSDHQSPTKSTHVPRAAEFIPSNPQIEAIKEVFLAHIEETDENEKSFTSLPAFEKFAEGMPEMVFETDTPVRIGRLDKVLQVLKTRKSAVNIPNNNLKK